MNMDGSTMLAEVVTNGKGRLFAQVAANREYFCWALTDADVSRFALRVHDEIEITACPEDQFCMVMRRYDPE